MNNKHLVIFIISFLGALIFSTVAFYFYNQSVNTSPVNLEECKSLVFNGQDAQNIVFFADKITSQKYFDYLLTIFPLNKNIGKFNAFYIDTYKPKCEIYKGVALLCYSKEILKKAASCPVDYVAVLGRESEFIRSSAYMNIMSINTAHPKVVIAHEFGHVFANLAEEYTPAKLQKGQKNCVKECSSFPEFKDGCYVGCSEDSYIRSVEEGIMRTLNTENFGKFNEFLIQNRIDEEVTLPSSSPGIIGKAISVEAPENIDCSKQEYYFIEFYYKNGNAIVIDKGVANGCLGSNGYGDNSYDITLEDDSTVYTDTFNSEFIFTEAQTLEQQQISGEVFDNEGVFMLKLPIIKEAQRLKVNIADKTLGMDIYDLGGRPCKV